MKKFKTPRQFNKCAKAWALLITYHNPDTHDAPSEFCNAVFNYTDKELRKMKLPEGWNQHGEYNEFVDWFIKNT